MQACSARRRRVVGRDSLGVLAWRVGLRPAWGVSRAGVWTRQRWLVAMLNPAITHSA